MCPVYEGRKDNDEKKNVNDDDVAGFVSAATLARFVLFHDLTGSATIVVVVVVTAVPYVDDTTNTASSTHLHQSPRQRR